MDKNSSRPLVSIALCTYNGEKYLREQLDSLVNQTYPNLEIVVVDDKSTDQTWEILKDYQSKFPSFNIVKNSENLGYQKNFEKALRLCKGEYLAISDQDDVWDPYKIQKLFDNIGENLLIYHDSEFVNAEGESLNYRMSDKFNMVSGGNPMALLLFNCVSGHSVLFKKELLQSALPFPEAGLYDHWLGYIACIKGTIAYFPECLVKHRQHSANSTDVLGRKDIKSKFGYTLERMRRENCWLKICSEAEEHPIKFIAKDLYLAGKDRVGNYFNPKFAYLIWKNRKEIMKIRKDNDFNTFLFSARQMWGAKFKQMFKFS